MYIDLKTKRTEIDPSPSASSRTLVSTLTYQKQESNSGPQCQGVQWDAIKDFMVFLHCYINHGKVQKSSFSFIYLTLPCLPRIFRTFRIRHGRFSCPIYCFIRNALEFLNKIVGSGFVCSIFHNTFVSKGDKQLERKYSRVYKETNNIHWWNQASKCALNI